MPHRQFLLLWSQPNPRLPAGLHRARLRCTSGFNTAHYRYYATVPLRVMVRWCDLECCNTRPHICPMLPVFPAEVDYKLWTALLPCWRLSTTGSGPQLLGEACLSYIETKKLPRQVTSLHHLSRHRRTLHGRYARPNLHLYHTNGTLHRLQEPPCSNDALALYYLLSYVHFLSCRRRLLLSTRGASALELRGIRTNVMRPMVRYSPAARAARMRRDAQCDQ